MGDLRYYELPAATGSRACKAIAAVFASFCLTLMLATVILPHCSHPQANRAKCSSNLHQIGLALIMYSDGDPLGRFAPNLQTLMLTQQLSSDVFICPSTDDTRAPGRTPEEQANHLYDGGHESYIYVGACLTKDSPSDAVALYEPLTNHKEDGSNVLFADGHVEYLRRPAIEQIIGMDQRGDRPIYWPPHPATWPSEP